LFFKKKKKKKIKIRQKKIEHLTFSFGHMSEWEKNVERAEGRSSPFWEKCGSVLQPYVREKLREERQQLHMREGNKLLEN
jgi:hypothetical protein